VASFLVKIIALKVARRISKARCSFAWNYIQPLQVLGYIPFRWIQLCAALKVAVQGEDRSADRGIHADGGLLIPAYQGG
jgi:hypothetical protein